MQYCIRILTVFFGLTVLFATTDPIANAANWSFGSDANGLTNLSSKTFSPIDSFELTLTVDNPSAGRFYESDPRGVSVDSSGIAGIDDVGGADSINLLTVGGVPAADVETVSFSFDKPGVLTGINFDGVKDEALEYFILTTSGGVRYNFFDSFANTSIPGAVDDAVDDGLLTGRLIYLLETGGIDDEAQGLNIPFAAGQQFLITYAELPPVAHGLYEPGNGARLQGITVVPEPVTCIAALSGVMLLWAQRRQSNLNRAQRRQIARHLG